MYSIRQSIAGITAALFLVIGGISIAYGQQNTPGNTDQQFTDYAVKDGLLDVALAKQAVAKTTNTEVKNFANQMIQAHTKTNQQLTQLAQKNGLQVPSTMGTSNEQVLKKFSGMSGADFDRAYINYEVKDHKKDVEKYSDEAKNGTKPDLKNFASQTVPELKQHLTMAQNVDQKIGATKTAAKHPWWEFWKKG